MGSFISIIGSGQYNQNQTSWDLFTADPFGPYLEDNAGRFCLEHWLVNGLLSPLYKHVVTVGSNDSEPELGSVWPSIDLCVGEAFILGPVVALLCLLSSVLLLSLVLFNIRSN
ncbi:hypothetical protein CRENBAI_013317 [Crenichthys baileyi]|uniref:Uncharacterized protein n=1 Tax=Crenichthys baileyi TaxID=28760 RepID=A0AAV9QN03_9TELE